MKTITTILAALLISTGLFAQEGLDLMGIPTENSSPNANKGMQLKNTKALITPIIKQFASPSTLPTSITFFNDLLWVIGYNDYKVYMVSPLTGNVVGTIPIAIQKPYGITFKDGNLHILDNINKKIFVYTETGVVLDTIDLALVSSPTYPTGLCSFDDELWYNDTKGPNPSATNDSLFGMSELLGINHSFESVGTFPSGITSDGSYLWVNDNPSQTTNMIDPISQIVLKSYNTPGGAFPNGVAYDGQGLWIINNASDSIYFMVPEGMTNINTQNNMTTDIKVFSSGSQIFFNYPNNWIGSEIAIFDCTGKMIHNEQLPSANEFIMNTDAKGFANGIYFVNLYNSESMYSEKIVIGY